MEISEIFKLQDLAAHTNIQLFPDKFRWCDLAIVLMVDTHNFLASDPSMIAHRGKMRDSDNGAFEAMNVVVNLAYDSVGSQISALRIMQYGVLADAWSLIRGAFESTCYAEFFALNSNKTKDYVLIAEKLKSNRSADIRNEIGKGGLEIKRVIQYLEKHDNGQRADFYGRLSNFGTHASPVCSGLRIKLNEPEVRAYLSIGHRELTQCLTDFAATANYTLGIPFEAWPDLISNNQPPLITRYRPLQDEFKTLFLNQAP